MAARVQIVVEAKDASSGVLRGITSQLGGLGSAIEELTGKNVSWGNITTQVTGMVVDGLKDSIKVTQEYAEEVRDQALASKTSAEESSRFLQVLDDYQITAQDATAATRVMTREGLAPTIDTVIDLSKEFQTLTTAEEQNQFMQKNLGRASREWLNLLSQGPEKIRAMNDAVSDQLILTQEDVDNMEKMRLAQDAWNDTVEGAKIQVGLFVGSLVAANEKAEKHIKVLTELGVVTGAEAQQTALLLANHEALTAQLDRGAAMTELYNQQLKNHAEAIEETATNYKSLLGSIQSYQDATDKYNETNSEIIASEKELVQNKNELQAKYNSLTEYEKKYTSEGKKIPEQIEDINKKLNEHSQDLAKNAEEYRKWAAQTVFSFAQARAAADGNISEIEGQVLIEAGEALGLFDEKTAEAMQSVNESFDNLDASNAQDVIANLQQQLNTLVGTEYTIQINVAGNTSTGGSVPGKQTGGTVYAGQQYMVGEAGPEPFFPATNGRVLSHAEALHAMSLGGGGGQTLNIYGPVTLAISSDAGGGLMEMR